MADLTQYKIFKNTNFEVLTDQGYKDFKGIIKGENTSKVKITVSSGQVLVCTPKHKLVLQNADDWIYAKDVAIGTRLYGNLEVVSVDVYESSDLVYELLHVEDNHRYYANGILSRQCLILDELAFIENNLIESFWRSVYPIISSSKKSKIFVASTPNGSGNLFYDLYTGAVKGENEWHPERVDWFEVPGRDEKWKELTVRSLGSVEAFQQEYGNEFLQSGETMINEFMFEKMKSDAVNPRYVFEEGHYLVWERPIEGHIYAMGVDVSEGVGRDASSVTVLDITDLRAIEMVAVYHSTTINPIQFTTKLVELLHHWGNPLVAIERNSCGGQVVDQLKEQHSYENIVSWSSKTGEIRYSRLGIFSHVNTKYRGVMNMRYYVHELGAVRVRDLKTLIELKSFTKLANGTWSGQGAVHDDRVMSLVWALVVLDPEVVDRYLEVVETDQNRRPLRVKSMDYGVQTFQDPTKLLLNMREDTGNALPWFNVNGAGKETDEGLEELLTAGWKPYTRT